MDSIRNVYNFINQESRFENEPKRVFVLLRWLYLLMSVYFAVFFFLMLWGGPHQFSFLAVAALGAMIALFLFTYRLRTKYNLIIYAIVQLLWVLAFVYLYGWDCGVQHFIFTLLVVIYFAVYDAIPLKIGCTVFLFLMRFAMFSYCRLFEPLIFLPNSFTILMQIYNSMFLFLTFGLICGMFSSNIESAEKKRVQYNNELKKQASTDPLTGIWNRRTMQTYMEKYCEQNKEASFVVAMGDIDYFKRINDQWGHDCGDAVLKGLTELFRERLLSKGSFSRWGGEEFMFLFPDMNGDEAYTLISDLLIQVQRHPFLWNGEEIYVTMTFGMEEYGFSSDISAMIRAVDEKLYIGKENGRNRIVF